MLNCEHKDLCVSNMYVLCALRCTHFFKLRCQKKALSVYHPLPISLRQGLSLSAILTFSQLVWKPASSSDSPVCALLKAGVKGTSQIPSLLGEGVGSKLWSLVIVTTKPSLQFSDIFKILLIWHWLSLRTQNPQTYKAKNMLNNHIFKLNKFNY